MGAVSFKPAHKAQSFLRMAIAGPSGSGKTYSSLEIATGLAAGRPIAVIDTERGSASKYAGEFGFDVLELDTYHPDRYIEAIEAAAEAGYAVLIIDSLTHAWNGTGGALELHDQAVKRQKTQNSYTAWADITPVQNRLVNAITGASLHVIATMRAKTEYIQDRNERGGTTIRKVGMAPIQRDGMEYEFDIFAQIDLDHNLIVEKSRCSRLAGAVIAKPGAQVAAVLAEWLRGDGDVSPAPAATHTAAPSPAPKQPQQSRQSRQPTSAPHAHPATPTPATTPAVTPHAAPHAAPAPEALPETLPGWGQLGQAAKDLGLGVQDWQATITSVTGKTQQTNPKTGETITIAAQLTDDDKRAMMKWLQHRHAQFAAADARTPPLETLSYAGA